MDKSQLQRPQSRPGLRYLFFSRYKARDEALDIRTDITLCPFGKFWWVTGPAGQTREQAETGQARGSSVGGFPDAVKSNFGPFSTSFHVFSDLPWLY